MHMWVSPTLGAICYVRLFLKKKAGFSKKKKKKKKKPARGSAGQAILFVDRSSLFIYFIHSFRVYFLQMMVIRH